VITLVDATQALDARKTSAIGDQDRVVGAEVMARVAAGLDLDITELHALATRWAIVALNGALSGTTDIVRALAGGWADGVVTGLLLAEMRSREEPVAS
jgi:hypothetical protein